MAENGEERYSVVSSPAPEPKEEPRPEPEVKVETKPEETQPEAEKGLETAENPDGEEEEHKKNVNGSAKRKLERDRLRLEVERLQRELQQVQPQGQPTQAQPQQSQRQRPSIDQFDTFAEYETALEEFALEEGKEKARQEFQADQYAQLNRHLVEELNRKDQELTSKLETAVKEDPSKAEALETFRELGRYAFSANQELANVVGHYLMYSEVGDKLALMLGADPDKAVGLLGMGRDMAIRELAFMEFGLKQRSDEPAPEPKPKVSAAPPPVRPVAGSQPSAVIPTKRYDSYTIL